MIISKDFWLKSSNFVKERTKKTQIVIGSTYNSGLNHFNAIYRCSGTYNKIPHFTITLDGKIYQHFNTNFYSLYLDCTNDDQIISIALENVGQLTKIGKYYYDVYNNIYNGVVFEMDWKNYKYWQPYTIEQYNSTIDLCKYLLNTINIQSNVVEINCLMPEMVNFNGICYRSNHNIKHYDVNPSWQFENFKKIIENG